MSGKSRLEHMAIITSAPDTMMSNDIKYKFHQNTNFNYLSGFLEKDCILILETTPNKPHPQHQSTLFVQVLHFIKII